MKYALCSEVFKTPITETIRSIAKIGFDGVEIAPFNIAESAEQVSKAQRTEIRKLAKDCGIEIVGLHWLLVSPKGLHITTPDEAVRKKSWDYLKALVQFCADLGGKVMVLGSPDQRNLESPDDFEPALERAATGLKEVARVCADTNVRFLLEPLHPKQTNFLSSVEEALRLIRLVDRPQIGYILDTRAMSGMPGGILGTINKYGQGAWHFHANEPGGLGPGMGDFDFAPVLVALKESRYQGWISAEPFHYEPDSETVARTALAALKKAAPQV